MTGEDCLVCTMPLVKGERHFCEDCFRLYAKNPSGISREQRLKLTRQSSWFRMLQDWFREVSR